MIYRREQTPDCASDGAQFSLFLRERAGDLSCWGSNERDSHQRRPSRADRAGARKPLGNRGSRTAMRANVCLRHQRNHERKKSDRLRRCRRNTSATQPLIGAVANLNEVPSSSPALDLALKFKPRKVLRWVKIQIKDPLPFSGGGRGGWFAAVEFCQASFAGHHCVLPR